MLMSVHIVYSLTYLKNHVWTSSCDDNVYDIFSGLEDDVMFSHNWLRQC